MWISLRLSPARVWTHVRAVLNSSGARGFSWATERPWRAGVLVFTWAMLLRTAFALILADTYDPDEFVILALSKAVAGGAVLYRDVTFFHPPGMLVLFAPLEQVVSWWWPSGRVAVLTLDSLTAVFVWRIGREVWGNREGLIAGLVYGVSPVALVSGVRIGPDPLITAFGVFGLMVLLTRQGRRYAVGAAAVLAIAVWIKYTALLYLPVYLLAANRHRRLVLAAWIVTLVLLFLPDMSQGPGLIGDTVLWQLARRTPEDAIHRIGAVGCYWLLLNPLAGVALWRARRFPRWLPVGFVLGTAFLLSSQAYYHYFVLFVPFGALLAAPLLSNATHRLVRILATIAIGLSCLWAVDIANGAPQLRLYVTAAHFNAVQQTARILNQTIRPGTPVLVDEFQYAMLSHHPAADNYFWNMDTVVRAPMLERRLRGVSAVVETMNLANYPPGFDNYLNHVVVRRYDTVDTLIWVLQSWPRAEPPVYAERMPAHPRAE